MTDCHRCGVMIQGQAFPRKEVCLSVSSDGKRETHYSRMPICKSCVNREKVVMARIAVFVILGAFAVFWLLEKVDPLSLL
jgi:hypothetical protein